MGAAVAAAITVLLWSSAFVGIRSAGRAFGPGELSLGRLLVATAALAMLGAVRGERLPSRPALRVAGPALLLAGLLWFGAYNLALNAGERHIDAGTAAMLVNIGPVLIAVASSNHETTTTGVLLCLAAAVAYAAGVVGQKVVLRSLTGTQTIFLCCVIGVVVCLPWSVALAHQLRHAPGGSVGWLVYLGLGPTALGFSTWAFALRRTDAGRLAATTYLVPPLSVLLGWLWLGETPVALAYLGGALCLAGVAVSRRRTVSAGPPVAAAVGSGSRP